MDDINQLLNLLLSQDFNLFLRFVEQVKQVNRGEITWETIIDSKNASGIYYFAKEVKGANVEKLGNAISKIIIETSQNSPIEEKAQEKNLQEVGMSLIREHKDKNKNE